MAGYYTNGMTPLDGNDISGLSFIPLDTGAPNGSPPQSGKIPPGTLVARSGIEAQADGTKANATSLDIGISGVTVVAGAADSVLLPLGYPGAVCIVANTIATAIQVFGRGTDTINGAATGTGVSQAASKTAIYACHNVTAQGVGQWTQLVGA